LPYRNPSLDRRFARREFRIICDVTRIHDRDLRGARFVFAFRSGAGWPGQACVPRDGGRPPHSSWIPVRGVADSASATRSDQSRTTRSVGDGIPTRSVGTSSLRVWALLNRGRRGASRTAFPRGVWERVRFGGWRHRIADDAERRGRHSHAERGNGVVLELAATIIQGRDLRGARFVFAFCSSGLPRSDLRLPGIVAASDRSCWGRRFFFRGGGSV
jgi:hypothetical protein